MAEVHILVKMFINLEVYHSSTISDYTTNNFYSLRRFSNQALPECGYPKWTIRKIREKQQSQQRKSKEKNKEKSRCMVTLPYVQGVTESVQRILKHHDITSAVRPHRNLRQILVHPKDKVEDKHKTDCVDQIPCKTCNMCHIGETGRTFGTRLEEHKKEVETVISRLLLARQGSV